MAPFTKIATILLDNSFTNSVVRYYIICATTLKVKFSIMLSASDGSLMPDVAYASYCRKKDEKFALE